MVIIVGVWFAEWHWIKNELREELALGTVGERDCRQVSKWFGRLGWELKFLAAFDLDGFMRVRKMYNQMVKPAFLKCSWRRRPRERTERRIAELRDRIARVRG
ncbi:MAG: hypothetical protein GTN49_10145 [candidate division Zixibacteria bacterium]|nr:hypothetical protein [candidate division Zixibacteria bacterium]